MKPPFDITADLDTPVSAYLKLAPFRPRFLLESVEGGERLAGEHQVGVVGVEAMGIYLQSRHRQAEQHLLL